MPNILSGIFLAFCGEASTLRWPDGFCPSARREDNAQNTTSSAWSKDTPLALCTPIVWATTTSEATAQTQRRHHIFIWTHTLLRYGTNNLQRRSCTSGSKAKKMMTVRKEDRNGQGRRHSSDSVWMKLYFSVHSRTTSHRGEATMCNHFSVPRSIARIHMHIFF
jgi:hypothetical protein